MNYSTFEISALWHWIERLFVYQADSPLMMGSIPFALLFIFFLAIYTLLKSYSRTAMMMYVICFSLFFAYKVNGMVMWMLPLTACINYAVTQEMRLHEGKARKALLTFVVLVDLALLCYFKYTNFIIGDVVNEMFSTNFSLQSIALPVGISFYTFQAISYAVDTYKRKFDMEVTLLEYCFYLTFFPLLMAGPITRAANLIPRLKRNEQASSRMLWTGLFLIMLGLVKKNMLSDYIAQFNNWVFDAPQTFSGFENLAALFGYPVQIFLDFSGIQRYEYRCGSHPGFLSARQLLFPLPLTLGYRVLASLAHLAFLLVPRLCVYSAGWKPEGKGAHVFQQLPHHAGGRLMAWLFLDVRYLGCSSWFRTCGA